MEFDRKYEGPKVSFKIGGTAYNSLLYVKMKSLPVSAHQLKTCLTGKFEDESQAKRSLMTLERNGCVKQVVPGKWLITPTGREVIYHVGRCRKSPLFIRGFGS